MGCDLAEVVLREFFVVAGGIAAKLVIELDVATKTVERFGEIGAAQIDEGDGDVCAMRPIFERERARLELTNDFQNRRVGVERRGYLLNRSSVASRRGRDSAHEKSLRTHVVKADKSPPFENLLSLVVVRRDSHPNSIRSTSASCRERPFQVAMILPRRRGRRRKLRKIEFERGRRVDAGGSNSAGGALAKIERWFRFHRTFCSRP